MMRSINLIICLCFTLISCEKENDSNEQVAFLMGGYTGTFQRKLSWSNSSISNVTLTFQDDRWFGSSDITKYPALCRGTFTIEGDSITFINECAWTAEFDWSLILSGKYKIERHDDQIKFYRDYRSMVGTFKDIYKLK